MNSNSKVSIVIPLYNREKLIIETIQSVQNQSYENFECIIIDDGSNDNSFAVVRDHLRDDARFIVLNRKSELKGACVCRNEGVDLATGDYIMFLDSDDLLGNKCLEGRINLINEHPNCDFIVKQTLIFDGNSYEGLYYWSSLKHKDDLKAFIESEGWLINSTFFKTSFLKSFRFDENAESWQDVDFHVRILLNKPTYMKFSSKEADVYVRRSNEVRISNTNTNFKRIESRIKLYLKLEKIFANKNVSYYKFPFLIYHFKYLEIAALTLSYKEFMDLYKLSLTSEVYSLSVATFYKKYLELQSFLNKYGLKAMCSILYRLKWVFVPKRYVYASTRQVSIKEKINIGDHVVYTNKICC
ncbi:glycosyltransferase family 2 protein [Pontibacter sp. BT731]|uniref:glycosyltransferase family 2 protein n=1 Tax=Pontibacter coccineus TaxID=3063328 RepID=UPI0026E154A6|nr:glycosyltransferase family 2 protein [Pontibacter sp. BT731]MDO6390233.1 glycosyltransferase family 2 protein [Pontibacter sp. BT731]